MANVQCLDERDEEIFEEIYMLGRSPHTVANYYGLAPRTVKNVALTTMKELAKQQFALVRQSSIDGLLLEKLRLEAQWQLLMQAWHAVVETETKVAPKASAVRFLTEARRALRDQRAVDALLVRAGFVSLPEKELPLDPPAGEIAGTFADLEPAPGSAELRMNETPIEGEPAIAVVELAHSVDVMQVPEPTPVWEHSPAEPEPRAVPELTPQPRSETVAPASLDSELTRILSESQPLVEPGRPLPTKGGPMSRRAAARLRQQQAQAASGVATAIQCQDQ